MISDKHKRILREVIRRNRKFFEDCPDPNHRQEVLLEKLGGYGTHTSAVEQDLVGDCDDLWPSDDPLIDAEWDEFYKEVDQILEEETKK